MFVSPSDRLNVSWSACEPFRPSDSVCEPGSSWRADSMIEPVSACSFCKLNSDLEDPGSSDFGSAEEVSWEVHSSGLEDPGFWDSGSAEEVFSAVHWIFGSEINSHCISWDEFHYKRVKIKTRNLDILVSFKNNETFPWWFISVNHAPVCDFWSLVRFFVGIW